MDARQVALLTLNACERQGGWSDGVLKKQLAQSGLDSRDAALATQICFGFLSIPLFQHFPQADGGKGGSGPAHRPLPDAVSDPNPPQRRGEQRGGNDPDALQKPQSIRHGQWDSARH